MNRKENGMSHSFLVCLPMTLFLCLCAFAFAAPAPVHLKCEYLVNPLGVDSPSPRLFWQMESNVRGERQTAYRILVADSEQALKEDNGDLWDSGKVESDRSIQIPYEGNPLASLETCWWKVMIWDQDGKPSGWSEPAHWTMGYMNPDDWTAKWIGWDEPGQQPADETRRLPARMFRDQFDLHGKPKRALVAICGLGLMELHINGERISKDVLIPALSEYEKRDYYMMFDVTKDLREGANAIGVILGNGRFYAPRKDVPTFTRSFGYPKMILQLHVEYSDGTTQDILSDGSWKVTTDGPILANNEYDGEDYDARKEMPGWDKPGFDDSNWHPVQLVSAPGGVLRVQPIHPIRIVDKIKPVSMKELRPGVYIYDMGQNMVGWCKLRVKGPAGTEITLRHAETLKPDGDLYVANLRSAKQEDHFILNGQGEEIFEPRFTYHGFRYVKLTGYPGRPNINTIEGCVVRDDFSTAGGFQCSNPLVNRIWHNIYWGTQGNYRSIPTDCPQRDERQGWLGDRSAESRGESYLFDVAAFYAKWMHDIEDAQKESGSVPDVCPAYWPLYNDDVTWPSSFIIIPHMLLDQYGDTRLIKEIYPAMRKWIEHMRGYMHGDLISKDNYGDWCVPPENLHEIHSKDPMRQTNGELLASAYFYHDLNLMTLYAKQLGRSEDAAEYENLAAKMKKAFNAKFLKPDVPQYDNGSMTSSVLPVFFGLAPENLRAALVDRVAHQIMVENHGHTGTGLIGGQFLMRTLSNYGHADVAWTLATQSTYPSWGYMVKEGATTIWELWNGNTADPAMNSGNHVMLIGDLTEWLYEYLGGIRPDTSDSAFKKIILKPTLVPGLNYVKASHESLYGKITSDWGIKDGLFDWNVSIPANTTATIYVPAKSADEVKEHGKPVAECAGLRFLRMDGGYAVYAAESGSYSFSSVP
jgi:alpha-L-rhamnosidase